MAKKHAKNAGFLIPDVIHSQAPAPPPRDLPFNIGTLLLPKLIREIASGKHIKEAHRASAHLAFKKWIDSLNAGKLNGLNETQIEGDFTGNLLTALGYQTQGDAGTDSAFNMIPKWSVDTGGIADVALGVFKFDEFGKVVGTPKVVVELKGAGVDLDRRVGGRTPVEQAWVYLNACESADWAIVSNFNEIRLYHRKGSNYVHRVRMIDLVDQNRFAEFYAVFHADALLGTGNFSQKTAWLLKETEDKQETVGEKLYEDYRDRRKELIRELTAKGYDFAKSVAAAQKLLDRILFVAFAEDRGLLDNSGKTLENTAALRAHRRTKWNNFQSLFEAIDQGDPPTEIPQYNGELFKRDDILDDPRFELDDKWPTVFTGIGQYDFKDEVTEAVLGRIFELSIEDIEKLKQGGLIDEPEPTDQKKPSRRKLQGVFYTNASIVDYLVHAALQPAYDAEKSQLAAKHSVHPDEPSAAVVKAMIGWLDTRTVCDPACGSGAFLSRAYHWFEDRRIQLVNQLHDIDPSDPLCAGHPDDWRARSAQIILSNNLYGVDLSGESVEIARLSLWIRTARRDQKLTNLAENVVQGNSVVSDKNVDKDHFFDWQKRFPRVFENGGFDAVIGNPPYVRQEHLGAIKEHLQANFQSYHGRADLYVYFYERGLGILKPGGRLAYVVTNKWMKAGYGEPLRRLFADKSWVESVVDFGHAKQFFKDIDVFPCFLVVRKPNDEPSPEATSVCVIPRESFRLDELQVLVPKRMIPVQRTRFSVDPWQLESQEVMQLLDKIRRVGVPLVDYGGVKPLYGLKTGFNKAFLIDTETKNRLVIDDRKSAEILKPYLRGQDIKRWSPEWAGLWMIVTPRGIDIDSYPAIKRHLSEFREQLQPTPDDQIGGDGNSRKSGTYQWYETQASVEYLHLFESPKLVYQDITWKSNFCLDTRGLFSNNTVYFLPTSNRWMLAVLNSPIGWWFAWREAQHGKDEALRYFNTFVERFAIPKPSNDQQETCEQAVNQLIELTEKQQETVGSILDWLKVEFDIAEPNTKLQNPIALDSDAFINEVKKVRGKPKDLTSPQLKTLRDEYARVIDPARMLADEARGLELRIHDLVNEAYGLTPDEVRLMWDTAPPRMPIARPPGI